MKPACIFHQSCFTLETLEPYLQPGVPSCSGLSLRRSTFTSMSDILSPDVTQKRGRTGSVQFGKSLGPNLCWSSLTCFMRKRPSCRTRSWANICPFPSNNLSHAWHALSNKNSVRRENCISLIFSVQRMLRYTACNATVVINMEKTSLRVPNTSTQSGEAFLHCMLTNTFCLEAYIACARMASKITTLRHCPLLQVAW